MLPTQPGHRDSRRSRDDCVELHEQCCVILSSEIRKFIGALPNFFLKSKSMPNLYFILFELVIYIQFALCLHHAWKQGTANLLKLFAGILFGVTLELATIRQLQAYEYGQFLIMVLDVPLCIGIAWSCIIYSAMEFSDASNLPYWTRPVL